MFRKFLAIILILATTHMIVAQTRAEIHNYSTPLYKTHLVAGSFPGYSNDEIKLAIEQSGITVYDRYAGVSNTIQPNEITSISYNDISHHRILAGIIVGIFSFGAGAIIALTKSHKNYVSINWTNSYNGSNEEIVLKVDSKNYTDILLDLESVSGKKPYLDPSLHSLQF